MILKTPLDRFVALPGYSFQSQFSEVDIIASESLQMHYVDYGPRNAPVILMLHGEPTWSYLYRKMITGVAEGGFRIIVPDLIGFGKSDKLPLISDYSYAKHLFWLQNLIDQLKLKDILLFCQDWGGLLGLRLLSQDMKNFTAVIASNTMLPTGDQGVPIAFQNWQRFAAQDIDFDIAKVVQKGTVKELIPEVVNAYNAPFPSEKYKAGARAFPSLVPTTSDNPESENNRKAWKHLSAFTKPFVTAFSDQDPITQGGEKIFQKLIPGCRHLKHYDVLNAGHFLQEDRPEELVDIIIDVATKVFFENIEA